MKKWLKLTVLVGGVAAAFTPNFVKPARG